MMTEDAKQLETILDNFVRNDVHMCASMLVFDLLHAELKPGPSDLAETIAELIEAKYSQTYTEEDGEEIAQEVFEWWFVSSTLGRDLQTLGVAVVDSAYGWIWGRTETGQSLTKDKDLRRVAAALIERTR